MTSATILLTSPLAVLGAGTAEAVGSGYTIGQCNDRPNKTILVRRFDFCLRTGVRTTDTVNGKIVGTFTANVTMVGGAPTTGSRTVKYTLSLSKVKAAGTLLGSTLRMVVPCQGSGCAAAQKSAIKPIATWKTKPKASFKFTAPPGTNAAKSSRGKTFIYGEVSGGGFPTKRTAQAKVATFRCDKAGYNNNRDGCVFPNGIPAFQPSASDPDIQESTAHILKALSNPGDTVPKLEGKTIPGFNTPLHRLRDDAAIRKNRRAAGAACRKEFPGYAKHGKQCDEYPFAATREGVARSKGRFSVMAISGDDNCACGDRLQQFFRANRILDKDPFYVRPKA